MTDDAWSTLDTLDTFKPGDIVSLKSGGPRMTVQGVMAPEKPQTETGWQSFLTVKMPPPPLPSGVLCVWFTEGGHAKSEWFMPWLLESKRETPRERMEGSGSIRPGDSVTIGSGTVARGVTNSYCHICRAPELHAHEDTCKYIGNVNDAETERLKTASENAS